MKTKSTLLFPLADFPAPLRIFLALLPTVLLIVFFPKLPLIAYQTPGALHFPIVVLTAWLGGYIPAIISTIVLFIFTVLYIWPEAFTSGNLTPSLTRTVLFIFTCGAFIILITALQRALEKAKKALILRDEFVSMASHELKTPLAALYLQIEIMKEVHKDHPSIGESIEITGKHLRRLSRLVTATLDLTMLDTGQINIRPSECDLQLILKDAIHSVKDHANDVGSEITLDSATSVIGIWDQVRIEQVFVNLLQNAIKYGNRKPIHVKLEGTENEAIISFIDSGIGIEKSEVDIIFNRYQRGTRDSTIQGIGLGLYLSKSIIDLHKGKIEVESNAGTGSIFRVRIPRTKK